jgi:hypothetical protein
MASAVPCHFFKLFFENRKKSQYVTLFEAGPLLRLNQEDQNHSIWQGGGRNEKG